MAGMKDYVSRVGFSISIPASWKVHNDDLEEIDLAEEERQIQKMRMGEMPPFEERYKELLDYFNQKGIEPDEEFLRMWREGYELLKKGVPIYEERYEKLAAELGKEQIVSFEEFVEIEKEREEREKAIDAQRLRNAEELGNQVGYFEASPDDEQGSPSVEVIKLSLRHLMTPLELYEKDKPHPDEVLEGKRPWRVRPVDGRKVIKYYYLIDCGEDVISFVNVYLVENQTGWIISCSSLSSAWNRYKKTLRYNYR